MVAAPQPASLMARAVLSAVLPESFRIEDKFGIKGGVEFGFMSTTLNGEVAREYASGENGLLFEIQLGMVDKGADLSWLSQVPSAIRG